MLKLLPILFYTLFVTILAEIASPKEYDSNGAKHYLRKGRFFFILLAIGLGVFAGLRTHYNDTGVYVNSYNQIEVSGSVLDGIDLLKIGESPMFNLIQRILRKYEIPAQSFLMLFSMLTAVIDIWFIRKYSKNVWLTVFLYMVLYYAFTLAAIRQCIAMSLACIAVDRAIEKKWLRFVFWVLLGSLFHPWALLFLVVPFAGHRPWSWRTYIILASFAVIAIAFSQFLERVVDFTTVIGKSYDIQELRGEGVNAFRLAVMWTPVLLSFIARRSIQEKKDRADNIIINLMMLNAEIMFIALFGTAIYFARLANYFLMFQVLGLPVVLQHFKWKSRQTITICAIIGYTAFFLYGTIVHDRFDQIFESITLAEYLKMVF